MRIMAAVLLCCFTPAAATAGLWYRGDLHSHSNKSDGDSSVAYVVAEAERQGLDFLALTDHDNCMGGWPAHWYDSGYASERLVLLYGMEWTTDHGHANVWSAAPFDYDPLWQANQNSDPEAACRAMHEQGGLFSLNHPTYVIGHRWDYPVPEETDCIEVWNSLFVFPSAGRAAVKLWDSLLGQGRRITAVGGSDKHYYQGSWPIFFTLGMPLTWVFSDKPTAEAILAGIRQGHVTISYSVDSPRLELAADADDDGEFETIMGDAAPVERIGPLSLRLAVTGPVNTTMRRGYARELPPDAVAAMAGNGALFAAVPQKAVETAWCSMPLYLALVYKNGRLCRAWLVCGDAAVAFRVLAGAGDYFRAELKGVLPTPVPQRLLYGYTLAITNPVYVDAAPGQ